MVVWADRIAARRNRYLADSAELFGLASGAAMGGREGWNAFQGVLEALRGQSEIITSGSSKPNQGNLGDLAAAMGMKRRGV